MIVIPAECAIRAGAVLAEGPVWHEGKLWWVDIESRCVHRFDLALNKADHWQLDDRVSFAIPSTQGDLIVGLGATLSQFDPTSGKATRISSPEPELTGNRFNDAKCDSAGRLWAGTMSIIEEPGCGSLYRVDGSCRIDRVLEGVSISNGLAWSGDDCTMYYIDSPTRRIDAFDFDPIRGEIANRRTVVEVKIGFPDGMCIDAAGHIWVALWGGWGVARFDPHTGKQLAMVEVPVESVTSCCFGGADLTELYITTASRDLDAVGRHAQPVAGSIFRADVGVPGIPAQLFAG